ncbi:MAG TPA: glycoside hydrolase family 95 protein [Acidobacteriaceae bacterium]|jgi:alpha-L-fucosidase 2|nr:glycoside hydrolase family 95 protein [Acidobacteriaceae bacterium]
MKRRQFLETIVASTAALTLPNTLLADSNAGSSGGKAEPANPDDSILWYQQPAKKWVDALPIGNGRLGAMVFGGTASERIQLNEDTVWSGGPYDPTNPKGPQALPEIRRLVFAGENLQAHRLFGRTMFGLAIPQMQYQPLGDLWLTFTGQSQANDHQRQLATDMGMITPKPVSDYRRQLDLDEAIVTVQYRDGGVTYKREVFASPVDQVFVVRLTADQKQKISFSAALIAGNSEQRDGDARYDAVAPNEIVVRGCTMSDEGIDGQVHYQSRARILTEGGKITAADDGTLTITDADAATILIAAGTSFVNYKNPNGNPESKIKQQIEMASAKSYTELRSDHVAAHQEIFRRVRVDLGSSESASLPTNERLDKFHETNDPSMAALYFQFGRYMLMSCSRPGSLPANLQGIWNDSNAPSWGGKYTTNINLQMNYWPAEPANLSDCAEPLFQMIADMAVPGARVAEVNYGVKGWVLHQNTDLWLACAPMDGPTWGTFATGGAWLCTHLWENYLFNGDTETLKKFYPLMKGSAQFFLNTLVEHPRLKWMVTCPSMSPEHFPESPTESVPFWDEVTNLHLKGTTICAGPTIDMSILRNLFGGCIQASEILGVDEDFRKQLQEMSPRLAPLQIGKWGQLQEWLDDWDDPEDHHRHMSPLWGLYPGHEITPRQTPKLAAAAAKLLKSRGDGGPGWGMAWKICLRARLLDGEYAYLELQRLLTAVDKDEISYKDGGTYPNLMNALPYQIDGNMGATAGIAEMLIQSHAGEIHLIPAIPKAWANGSVKGLKARGGFVVDMKWKDNKITNASVDSKLGGTCRIRSSAQISKVSLSNGNVSFTRPEQNLVEFKTKAGETYSIEAGA